MLKRARILELRLRPRLYATRRYILANPLKTLLGPPPSPAPPLASYISRFNKQLLDYEKTRYAQSNCSEFPFNLHRHILNLPFISVDTHWHTEEIWMTYATQYDLEYLKNTLLKSKDLRAFWVTSFQLSLTSVALFRDILSAVKQLVHEKDAEKYFNHDLYNILVGFYLLQGKLVLAKTAHKVLYRRFAPQDLEILVKCCCLGSEEGYSYSGRFATLSEIARDINGKGVYSELMGYLTQRFLYVMKASDRFQPTTLDSSSEENYLEDALQLYDINMELLRAYDIPRDHSILVGLIRFLNSHIINQGMVYSRVKQGIRENRLAEVQSRLRRTILFFANNPKVAKILEGSVLKKSEAYKWSFPLIIALVDACFTSGSRSTYSDLRLFFRTISNVSYTTSPKFWKHLYDLCRKTNGTKLSFTNANRLFIEFAIQKPLEDSEKRSPPALNRIVCDYIYENPKYNCCLEAQIKVSDESGKPDKYLFAVVPLVERYENPGLAASGELALTPKIIGSYVSYLCKAKSFEVALDFVEKFLNAEISTEFVTAIAIAYINSVKQSFFSSLTPAQLSHYHMQPWASIDTGPWFLELKKFLSTLEKVKSIDLDSHASVVNRIACFTLSLNRHEDAVKMVNSLCEKQGGVLPETGLTLAKGFLRAHQRANQDEMPYKILYDSVVECLSKMLDFRGFYGIHWYYFNVCFFSAAKDFSAARNMYFWALNKQVYSAFYEGESVLKLDDSENRVLLKLSDMNIDHEQFYEHFIKESVEKVRDKEIELNTKGGTPFNLSQTIINVYYSRVRSYHTPTFFFRLISYGIEKSPQKPFEGLELAVKAKKLGLVSPWALDHIQEEMEERIRKDLQKLYYMQFDAVDYRWKAAKTRNQAFSEYQAQQEFLAFSKGDGKAYHIYDPDEVAEVFHELVVELFSN